jgi:hypothetical protein
MIFVFDILRDGVWEPWYMGQMSFRRALKYMNLEKDISRHRVRRVKTLEELEGYILQGIFKAPTVKMDDLWKVRWV